MICKPCAEATHHNCDYPKSCSCQHRTTKLKRDIFERTRFGDESKGEKWLVMEPV